MAGHSFYEMPVTASWDSYAVHGNLLTSLGSFWFFSRIAFAIRPKAGAVCMDMCHHKEKHFPILWFLTHHPGTLSLLL